MNRDEIYAGLEVERFIIARRDCTPRIMAATNVLLDQLLEIQDSEAVEMLSEEANV